MTDALRKVYKENCRRTSHENEVHRVTAIFKPQAPKKSILFKNRTGALELSITGIVVLIIAITLLTFGVMFIRKLFGSAFEQFQSQFEQLGREINDGLRNSGKLLDYRIGSKSLKRGEEIPFAIGIRNSATSGDREDSNEVCFRLSVTCKLPFNDEGSCIAGEDGIKNVVVGGADLGEGKPDNWFSRFPSLINIKSNDIGVVETLFLVRTAPTDRYEMALRVDKAEDDMPCSKTNEEFKPYESVSFTIDVAS